MEDVKGGFNNIIGQEMLNCVAKSDKRGWCRWLVDFFRLQNFDVEWDGKVRGRGSIPGSVPHLDGTDIRTDGKTNEGRGRERGGKDTTKLRDHRH